MPTWRSRTPRSRTFSAENSDAVSQARGDPDHDRRTRFADRPRLPGSPAVAGGVLQAGNGLGGAGRGGHRGVAGDRGRGAALGLLEVSRPAAGAGLWLEPQANLAGVLPAAPEPAAPDQAARSAAGAPTALGRAADERGLGARFHARHALQRQGVPDPERDRRSQSRGLGHRRGDEHSRLRASSPSSPR